MKKIFSVLFIAFSLTACSYYQAPPPPTAEESAIVEEQPLSSDGIFKLTSAEVEEGGRLPKEFTCDGSSATLPLEWSGAPANTKSFAVIMHHIPGPGDSHWYWIVYNIPAYVTRLEKNENSFGIFGNNSVNGKTGYAPPCSKGPGEKIYTYSVYALSAEPRIAVAAEEVNRGVLLDAIQNITLASAVLNVTYTR